MHCWIFEIQYTLIDGFPELLSTKCLPPIFKLNNTDGKVYLELNILNRSDTLQLSPQLCINVLHINNIPGGGMSLGVG